MKTYRDKIVPEHTEKVLDEIQCDFCQKVAKYGNWTGTGSYDVEETEVKISMRRKSGKSYPEGGYSQEIEINICPTCFDEIVLPFFKTKGVDPEIIEWEY